MDSSQVDHRALAQQLLRQGELIRACVALIHPDQARWKPTSTDWSGVEVVNHLYDEEREDFRTRIDFTLHRPGEAWPPIDPVGWVTERNYLARDLDESLQNFLEERQQSVRWLESLQTPEWSRREHHPSGFTISAHELLGSWLAHDMLHLRQLTELHYQWIKHLIEPGSVEYAGEW